MVDSCRLVYIDGVASVFDEAGNKSKLYDDALEYTEGNQEEALEIWGATQTKEFISEVGDIENPPLNTVLRFLNNRVDNPKTLSKEELKSVSLLMNDLGITGINDFTEMVNKLFLPKGFYAVDTKKLMNSGLYSLDDIMNLNHVEVKEFIDKLNYYNQHKEYNLTVGTNENKIKLRNTTVEKTPLGSYPLVSEQELVEYIVDNATDLTEAGINKAVGDSPFSQVLASPKGMKAIYNILRGKTKVDKMFFDGASFTKENIGTFVTVRNTLLADADPIELEADLEYIESIPQSVWIRKIENVRNILKGIEKTAIKYNIDIIGLSDLVRDRDAVISVLSSLDDMLLLPSMENIQKFAQTKDEKISPEKPYVVLQLNDAYKGYNVVKIDTNMSDDVMFQSGFIKLDNNGLYHRVQRTDVNEMYEAVYDKVMDNSLIIPNKYFEKGLEIKTPENKDKVMLGIINFINSRDTGIDSQFNEEISLFQVIFAHKGIKNSKPQQINTEQTYLKTAFVSDFYNYILEQKQGNTDLYNKVLRHFSITDGDITLNAIDIPDVSGIKYENELRDYAKLKKGGQIKELVPEKGQSTNDLDVLNNPNLVKEEGSTAFVSGGDGYILSEKTPNTYMRVGSKLYRAVLNKADGVLFKEVLLENNNPLYFDTNTNFDFNKSEAESAYKNLKKGLQKTVVKTSKELAEQVNISNKLMPIQYQIIGEQGASRMIEYKQQLDRAKELEKEGKTPAQIELETGWYKYKGDWRTIPKEVVESFQIKDKTVNKELTLKQVLGDDSTIFSFYPEISGAKVVFLGENYKDNAFEEAKKQTFGFVDEKTGTIYINMATTNPSTGDRINVEEDEQIRTLAHEVNHLIQSIEGFPTGGNLLTVAYKAMDIIGEKELTLVELYDKLINKDLANLDENERLIVSSTIEALRAYNTTNNTYGFTKQYNHLLGEIDSKIVEEAINFRNKNEAVPNYLQLFNKVTTLRGIDLNSIIVVKGEDGGFKLNIAQKDSKETVDNVIQKLKQTGLAEEVHQLNTQQLLDKLKEFGVSDDIAMQVAMQIKNGYYSNAQTAFTNLKDKNVKNIQGWLKALTDVQKNGGVKNVNQELEWIGLEDFLNEYVKENNPKNGNIPASVVEEYILSNQIEIVDVSKEGLRLTEPSILEDETYNNINEELSRQGIEDEEGLLNQWYYAEEGKNQKWENLATFLESNNIDLEYLIEKSETDSLTPDETKYSAYQLKGAENYREILLTIPDKRKKVFGEMSSTLDYAVDNYGTGSQEYINEKKRIANILEDEWGLDNDAINELFNDYENSSVYKSSHWDEANILAHVRLNEKTLPDGRRVLIMNEIQADISQDLKKEQDKILDRVDKEFDNFLDNLIMNKVITEEC